jgi:N-methylhydantoinase B
VAATSPADDPVTLEVVRNALGSIADEMALVIMRTAYSTIVRDSMDYSTGICDRAGRVIGHGLTMALHLGSFPDAMAALIADRGGRMRPGDVYAFNDPYLAGGMHLPDVYVIAPIFHAGEVEGYAVTVVHQIDIGGLAPGSTAVYAREIYQEGLRLPIVALHEEGRPNEAVFRILAANSRVPDKLAGDMRAQLAACRTAERGYRALLERHGAPAFRAIVERLHDHAERMMRAAIAALPDGSWSFTDWLDGLGETPEPLALRVRVTVSGERLVVDWEGTAPQVPAAINCPPSFVKAAVTLAMSCVAEEEIPNFEGHLRPIEIRLPPGTLVNPAPPAACAARAIIGWRAIDTLLGAFAQIVPDRIPAAGEGGVTFPAISGHHRGRRFVCSETLAGSWGGMAGRDGVFGIPNAGGNITNQPVEMVEAQFPLEILRYGMVEDSGGPGRWRGAPAYIREYRMLGEETVITMRSDRRRFLPYGLQGGLPGTPSLNILNPGPAQVLAPVMPMGPLVLRRGEVLRHIGAGGGGFGDPLEREPLACLDDVREERFSAAHVEAVHGVVLTADGTAVDQAATAARRAALRAAGASAQPPHLARFLAAQGLGPFVLEGERELRLVTAPGARP